MKTSKEKDCENCKESKKINIAEIIVAIVAVVISVISLFQSCDIGKKQVTISETQNKIAEMAYNPIFEIKLKTDENNATFVNMINSGTKVSNVNISTMYGLNIYYNLPNDIASSGKDYSKMFYYYHSFIEQRGLTIFSQEEHPIPLYSSQWRVEDVRKYVVNICNEYWNLQDIENDDRCSVHSWGTNSLLNYRCTNSRIFNNSKIPNSLTFEDTLFLQIKYTNMLGIEHTEYYKSYINSIDNSIYMCLLSEKQLREFKTAEKFEELGKLTSSKIFNGSDPVFSGEYILKELKDEIIDFIERK